MRRTVYILDNAQFNDRGGFIIAFKTKENAEKWAEKWLNMGDNKVGVIEMYLTDESV